jgi:plasmid rolling circle replication initiator protein Rep
LDYDFLHDVKGDSVKEMTWRLHRLITLRLAKAYKRIGSRKYRKVVDCGGLLEFKRFEDGSLRLKYATFCKTRLCPMCNWRRSMKTFAAVSRIMNDIENNYGFVFLTLTSRNIEGRELSGHIDKMVSAYKKLIERKRFTAAVRGWVRCFEVTHNWQSREYHPHYHCILAVDKTYFKSELYIQQDEWCELWRSCMDLDYTPVVDIRAFTESEKGKGKEVAEVAKYTIKSSNIMANLNAVNDYGEDVKVMARRLTDTVTDEIVMTLDSALKNRRLMGFGGIFKQKHKDLNIKDDDDLIHTGTDITHNVLNYEIERYRWDIQHRNYIKTEKKGGDNEDEKTNCNNADD